MAVLTEKRNWWMGKTHVTELPKGYGNVGTDVPPQDSKVHLVVLGLHTIALSNRDAYVHGDDINNANIFVRRGKWGSVPGKVLGAMIGRKERVSWAESPNAVVPTPDSRIRR